MKKIVAVVLAFAFTFPATMGMAQDEATPTRFYDFNDMLIDGEFMRPEGMTTRARDGARFERLIDLRREFIEEIEESAKEQALE